MKNDSPRTAKLLKIANVTLKVVIVVLGMWFLYKKLVSEKNLSDIRFLYSEVLHSKHSIWFLISAIMLMPLNLFLESKKWQMLVGKVEKVSLSTAFTAVLTGISVSMFLPNRTGESLGRIFFLQRNRLRALMASIVGSLSQLLCTLVFGFGAVVVAIPFFYPFSEAFPEWLYWSICVVSVCVAILIVILYYNVQLLRKLQFLFPKKYREKINYYVSIFKQFTARELTVVLLLAALRYLVFSFQFVLLIWAFGIPMNYFESMLLIMLMYFFLVMIPIITIAEPAIRGSVSVYLFERWFALQAITVSSMSVFAASTTVWLINLALPAVFGLFFVYRLSFFRLKK